MVSINMAFKNFVAYWQEGDKMVVFVIILGSDTKFAFFHSDGKIAQVKQKLKIIFSCKLIT